LTDYVLFAFLRAHAFTLV